MTVRTHRIAAWSTAAAASVVLLAGCGNSATAAGNAAASPTAGSPSPSSTGPMSTAGLPMRAQPAGPHNEADVNFARQMTVHHQGAIMMADLAATRASSAKVKTLAEQIKAAQAPEIKQMAGWLAAWAPDTDMNGMPNTTAESMAGMGGTGSGTSGAPSAMPGMMSAAQMSQLTAATGPAFDKLFLR